MQELADPFWCSSFVVSGYIGDEHSQSYFPLSRLSLSLYSLLFFCLTAMLSVFACGGVGAAVRVGAGWDESKWGGGGVMDRTLLLFFLDWHQLIELRLSLDRTDSGPRFLSLLCLSLTFSLATLHTPSPSPLPPQPHCLPSSAPYFWNHVFLLVSAGFTWWPEDVE